MIRTYARTPRQVSLGLLAAFAFAAAGASAQTAPIAINQTAPAAPTPAPMAPVFPKPDPANFTATTPSRAVLEAFLQSSWGKVENRTWQIQAILKTQIPDISHVVVLVGDKTGKEQTQIVDFLAFADGKHFLAGDRMVDTEVEDSSQPKPAPGAQPVPAAPTDTRFPAPKAENFTSATPTVASVDAFTRAMKGFDDSIAWQVEAIQKTQVPGLVRVVVMFAEKKSTNPAQPTVFFVLPDGKHIAASNEILPFGDNPFAETRKLLEDKATGPYRGAADKNFEIVEFADFQCPHCKLAQPNIEKLATDYPNARIVFEAFPLGQIHPAAVKAATYAGCVAQLAGSTAFFNFAAAVFDGQDGLETPDGTMLTLNSALTKAGVDQAKVTACVGTPAAKATVDASVALAAELHLNQVPTLFVNGRPIPGSAPYDVLKKVIDYQLKMDGITK